MLMVVIVLVLVLVLEPVPVGESQRVHRKETDKPCEEVCMQEWGGDMTGVRKKAEGSKGVS